MAKLLIKNLDISYANFVFNAHVLMPVTVVGGDSSTGKSLWFTLHREKARLTADNKFFFINAESVTSKEQFIHVISAIHNAVIWVDNADIVVPKDYRVLNFIDNSKDCQFIFLGRQVGNYSYSYDSLALMKEIKPCNFKLEYVRSGGRIK